MTSTLHWHGVMMELSRRDSTPGFANGQQPGPTRTSRAMALTMLAVYNAVAAKERPAALYRGPRRNLSFPAAPQGARLAALIDGAASTMLAQLYPAWAAEVQAQACTPADDEGYKAGAAIACVLHESRSQDAKSFDSPPAKRPWSHAPYGAHQADPYDPEQIQLHAHYGALPRFGCVGPARIDPPFDLQAHAGRYLRDALYRDQFAEVQAYGRRDGSQRAAEQTEIGTFWGYDGARELGVPPRLYNQIARNLIAQRLQQGGMLPADELEIAGLLAMVNVAMADAGIEAWRAKSHYNLWRPVVAIRNETDAVDPADGSACDPLTPGCLTGDPGWAPLGAPQTNQPGAGPRTPPFPAYPSGHATFGAALFQALALRQGCPMTMAQVLEPDRAELPGQAFSFVSDEYNGQSRDADGSVRPLRERRFPNYAVAVWENAVSRVYLGVHWRFDGLPPADRPDALIGGVPLGFQVAQDAYTLFADLLRWPEGSKANHV